MNLPPVCIGGKILIRSVVILEKIILAFYSDYRGSGKSTAADYTKLCLDELYADKSVEYSKYVSGYISGSTKGCTLKLSFASTIRTMASSVIDMYKFNAGNKNKALTQWNNKTPRDILIWLGQSGRQFFGDDIWINQVLYTIDKSSHSIILIDDLRMKNEYKALKNLGAYLIKVLPDPYDESKLINCDTENQLSEDRFDYILINPLDSLYTFYKNIEIMLKYFKLN